MLLGKGALKICSIFTKEHPSRRAISIKLLWNFIEIVLRHGCSPVKLLHIIRTPFPKNTSGPLLLLIWNNVWQALWKNVFPWERLCSGLKWSKTTKNLFWKSTNSAQLIFIEHYHYKNQKTSKVFHNIRIFKWIYYWQGFLNVNKLSIFISKVPFLSKRLKYDKVGLGNYY